MTTIVSRWIIAAAFAFETLAPNAPGTEGPYDPAYVPSFTDINGVYTGTYNYVNLKISLKISHIPTTHNDNWLLTGFLTFDLPADQYVKGSRVTYKLTGPYIGIKRFQLEAEPWRTMAPAAYHLTQLEGSYTDARGIRFPTTRFPADRIVASPIIDLRKSTHLLIADRDKVASANLDSVMAAQSEPVTNPLVLLHPPPSPEEAARAAAAYAEAVKTAPPAQPAPKGLVRKSEAYWARYQSDLIRQIFDGGVGSGIESDSEFQKLFTTYVEEFSKNCRDSLPAQHDTLTVTVNDTKWDPDTKVVRVLGSHSTTVEVDSRFTKYYRDYGRSLTSVGQAFKTLASGLGGLLAPTLAIQKFFATETCQSAAMRQLGENFLRAAAGKPSLQQEGATIAGAEAETDKSLPPGRYLHFVDACNAYYNDPVNAKYWTPHSSAWCNCLAKRLRMSRDEEYYYANDFKNRFLKRIAQPKRSVDVTEIDEAWTRLHPACDACINEVNQ